MPFLFYRFGRYLRDRSKYAQEAQRIMQHILKTRKKDDAENGEAEAREAAFVNDRKPAGNSDQTDPHL